MKFYKTRAYSICCEIKGKLYPIVSEIYSSYGAAKERRLKMIANGGDQKSLKIQKILISLYE